MNLPVFSTCRCFCLALLACNLWACSNEADKLAKKRIFSPEAPPLAVSAAQEVVQAEALATKTQLVQRVVHMGIAETTERLGAHRFSANLRMEWQGNGRKQALTEERLLLSAQGGVSGNFSASLRNNRGQGYDILRVGHQVFAKSLHGNYRQRLRDRGMAERMRQEAFGVLAEVDNLFLHRIKLQAEGKEGVEGREAFKYLVVLGETPRTEKTAHVLPKLTPKKELDESSRLRLAFFEHRQPETLTGKLWVDATTAVVLKVELQGSLKIPDKEADSLVHIRLAAQVDEIGKNPPLAIPDAFIPDEDKPQGIAAALERFGLGRKSRAEADSATETLPDED